MGFRGVIGVVLLVAAAAARGQSMSMEDMEKMEPMDHWMTMVHGYVFANYDDQGGPSGGQVFESQNHFMGMAMRSWLGGKLSFYGTLSLEPATIPSPGSPELFQVGETNQGVLLVDLQHPHDFFVQIAGSWEKALSPELRLRFYGAVVGEPAMGPPAYVHRRSAMDNPTTPLSHHTEMSNDDVCLCRTTTKPRRTSRMTCSRSASAPPP